MKLGLCVWGLSLLLLRTGASDASTDHSWTNVLLGSAVDLHCEAPEGTDMENMALEWTRPDLDESYVFLFRDGRPFLVYQHDQFKGRVGLKDPTLSSRDLSIRLQSVEPQDSGRYECHVFSQSHVRKRSSYNTQPITTIDLTVTETKTVRASPGEDVLFLVDRPDFNVTSLTWKREDDPERFVFLFGMNHPHHQDPLYSGRTELQTRTQDLDRHLTRTDDLSMILRRVQPRDSGVYHCHIVQSVQRRKRQLIQSQPYAVIVLKVEPDFSARISGAPRPQSGSVLVFSVSVLVVSLFLQILD